MKSWCLGQRVLVHEVGIHGYTTPLAQPASGTVVRLLMLNPKEAWIALDSRLTGEEERHHGFPADDPYGRGTHVPSDVEVCEPMRAALGLSPEES